jgi:hypothetical protein
MMLSRRLGHGAMSLPSHANDDISNEIKVAYMCIVEESASPVPVVLPGDRGDFPN